MSLPSQSKLEDGNNNLSLSHRGVKKLSLEKRYLVRSNEEEVDSLVGLGLNRKPVSRIRRCERDLKTLRKVLTSLLERELLVEMQDSRGRKGAEVRVQQIQRQQMTERKNQVLEKIKNLEKEWVHLQVS